MWKLWLGQKVPAASAHKEMTNNFFTTYFMALNVAALGRQDDVGEVLVVEEPGEDPQHVALVVVPLEAVLLGPAAHPAFCRYHPETQNIKILSLKTIKKSFKSPCPNIKKYNF